MPTVYSLIAPAQQWEDASGNPYVGAKLFTYTAGTTTKKTTYTEADGVTPNPNPVILNSRGETASGLWGATGAYKLVLAPSTDTDPPVSPFWTRDNITGVNDLAVGLSEWVTSPLVPAFISGTSFSVVGDSTATLSQNRRLRITIAGSTLYATIVSSVFAGGITTLVIANDTVVIDATISALAYGLIAVLNTSLPVIQAYYPTFRNKIINGDMRIDQLNAGAAVSVNSAANFFGPDMWVGSGQAADGIFSIQRSTAAPPPGYSHFLRMLTTTIDAAIGAAQIYRAFTAIEGVNAVDLGFGAPGAAAVTLSFLSRCTRTGAFSGVLNNNAGNRSYPFLFTINAANVWETKTVTIPGDVTGTWPTDTTAWGYVVFDLGAGTSVRGPAGAWAGSAFTGATGAESLISAINSLDVVWLQLEPGSAATAFERLPFGAQLQRCQRYFQKSFHDDVAPVQASGTFIGSFTAAQVVGGASGQVAGRVELPVWMRVTPTLTLFNPSAANAQIRNSTLGTDWSASGTVSASTGGFGLSGTGPAGSASGNTLNVHWTASARL